MDEQGTVTIPVSASGVFRVIEPFWAWERRREKGTVPFLSLRPARGTALLQSYKSGRSELRDPRSGARRWRRLDDTQGCQWPLTSKRKR